MSFEFLGICDNSSVERMWWGPDGSMLDYVPYINTESFDRIRIPDDSKIFEMAWRIVNMPSGSTDVSVENSSRSFSIEAHSRYGRRIAMNARGCVFNKNLEKTALKWTITDISGNKHTIIVKNISLIPGQNQGFSIEVEE